MTHQIAGAKQSVLDGSQRQARDVNDFFISQILLMAQDDQLPVSGWQRPDYKFNLNSSLFPFRLLLRRQALAFKRKVILIVFIAADQRPLAS